MANQKSSDKADQVMNVIISLPIGQPVSLLYSFPGDYSIDDMFKCLWSKKYIRVQDCTEIQVRNIVAIKIEEVRCTQTFLAR